MVNRYVAGRQAVRIVGKRYIGGVENRYWRWKTPNYTRPRRRSPFASSRRSRSARGSTRPSFRPSATSSTPTRWSRFRLLPGFGRQGPRPRAVLLRRVLRRRRQRRRRDRGVSGEPGAAGEQKRAGVIPSQWLAGRRRLPSRRRSRPVTMVPWRLPEIARGGHPTRTGTAQPPDHPRATRYLGRRARRCDARRPSGFPTNGRGDGGGPAPSRVAVSTTAEVCW